MFKHFIGKIYILEEPPIEAETQLDIPFPEEIIGDLDKQKYEGMLTNEQLAKLKVYQDEMGELLGIQVYEKMRSESVFQSSNSDLIKHIAIDLTVNPSDWNGLHYLNEFKPEDWTRLIYKIINLQPGNWETRNKTFVEFIKIIAHNWEKSIPELLQELENYDVGVNEFFKLERNVTFKFTSLLKDLNSLQKVLLKSKNYDISRFITLCSQAFLPKVVFQLEEYGMPRMISKKLQESKIIDFYSPELTIHRAIEVFNEIGKNKLIEQTENLDDFDIYILEYFFDGIKTTNAQQ